MSEGHPIGSKLYDRIYDRTDEEFEKIVETQGEDTGRIKDEDTALDIAKGIEYYRSALANRQAKAAGEPYDKAKYQLTAELSDERLEQLATDPSAVTEMIVTTDVEARAVDRLRAEGINSDGTYGMQRVGDEKQTPAEVVRDEAAAYYEEIEDKAKTQIDDSSETQ